MVTFLVLDFHHLTIFRAVAGDWSGYPRVAALALLAYLPQVLVAFALAAWLSGRARAFEALGLARSPLTGFAVAGVGTAVMFFGLLAVMPLAPPEQPLIVALRGSLLPGIGEEVLYRGLLFGFLFRFARWGFLPAAFGSAVLFGAAHLYQGSDLAEAAAIAAYTGLGGLFLAWLYCEWDYNLWVPIGFHVLMNLYWEFFAVSDNALGPAYASNLRYAVIAVAVAMTLYARHRRGGRRVRGRTWWRNEAPPWPAVAR